MTEETEIEMLKRVVDNQSVMLHNLKEKIQSLVNLSNLGSEPVKAWEILNELSDWADECDTLTLEQAPKRQA